MPFNDTGIRWTDKTWNPVHGCSKTSEGCKNCYAEAVSHRFNHTEQPWTVQHVGENITLKERQLSERLRDPCWVFVNSMSDLLHPAVPDSFVAATFDACYDMGESAFQILTKHGADNDRDLHAAPPTNVMLGVSVESARRQYRIDWLRDQPATTKFISFEPLVECIPDPDLSGIDWAIIGGESGSADARREMPSAWARNLVRACRRQDVAVFFKQHSGSFAETNVRLDMQDGRGARRIEEFPELPDHVVPAPSEFLQAPKAADGGFTNTAEVGPDGGDGT